MIESGNHPFDKLTPDLLIDAVESQGFLSDGGFLALNSYENRVYQIGIENKTPMIAKFYRPNRWTDEQIFEEHQFCFQLQEQELPVVCPWLNSEGKSISHHEGFRFALYERKGGRAPELDNLDNLFILGRLLGRFHGIGATQPFKYRPTLNVKNFGWDSYELISKDFMPKELSPAYDSLALDVLKAVDEFLPVMARLRIFEYMVIATRATFCGVMITPILLILMTPAWRPQSKIFGCYCLEIGRSRQRK